MRQRCVQHVHTRLLAAGVDVAPVHQHGEPRGGGAGGGVAAEQRQTTKPGAVAWPRVECPRPLAETGNGKALALDVGSSAAMSAAHDG